MRVPTDLYSIHGDLLASKGAEITPSAVRRIRNMGGRLKSVSAAVKDTFIFSDIRKVFDDPRYSNILRRSARQEICDMVAGVKLEDNIVFELKSMKSMLPYTYRHAMIVAALALKLSSAYRPGTFDKLTVARCGLTHDIGKTRVPAEIIEKSGMLTPDEKKIMNGHTMLGYLLLCHYLKKDRTICPLANLNHHERLDGSGYPRGIKKIGLYAQLISIVDILDALMTVRPYRNKPYTLRASLDYLINQARMKRFHMGMVLPLISMARKEKSGSGDLSKLRISQEIREDIPD